MCFILLINLVQKLVCKFVLEFEVTDQFGNLVVKKLGQHNFGYGFIFPLTWLSGQVPSPDE